MPVNEEDQPIIVSLDTTTLDGEEHKFQTLDSQLFSDTMDSDTQRKVRVFPKGGKLILLVEHKDTTRTLSLEKRLILGRKSPESAGPLVDLTGAGAYQRGVSRQHAALRRTSEGFVQVKDLGSKNGTFINGRRLKPLQRYFLDHGDRLHLGELVMRVSFDPAPEGADNEQRPI